MTQANAPHPSSEIYPPANLSRVHLATQIALRFPAMTAVAIAILFLPAGTVRWWQGWAFLATWILTVLAAFLYFLKTDPQLAERRLRMEEKVREQKWILRLGVLLFAGFFMLPGFDRRFGWSRGWLGAEPIALELFSLAMMFAAMLAVVWVLRTNRYAGRTVRVEEGQTVVSSGPYRVVRHPMYSFTMVMWVFALLALGSYVMLPAVLLLVPVYVMRILNEEKVLRAELSGYTEYCERTRWRLVPGVW